jgi:hypothetical protein
MNTRKDQPEDQALLRALRALAREDEGLSAPRRVEARLMQAFDETRTRRPQRHAVFGRQFLKAAAVFVLAVGAGYWWSGGGPTPRADHRQPPSPSPAVPAAWPSSEALPWLDPEPGSLQIVYVQVTGEALAAQGYSVGDPDGDGLVDLEVIVGLDGLARGVRVAPATAVIY